MKSNPSPFRHHRPALLLAIAMLPLAGCVSRGYPTHGGGKRFFHEQALVAGAIDAALAKIDFHKVTDLLPKQHDHRIGVHLFSVAHSGGGVQTGSTGLLGGLFGALPILGAAPQERSFAVASPLAHGGLSVPGYQSFGFESADDIRYLMGRMIGSLGTVGLRVYSAEKQTADEPVLCVLVRQLGIDQSDFDALVYSEKLLRARADFEVFLVHSVKPTDSTVSVPEVARIGAGVATMQFREDFFLGFGPISGGEPELETSANLLTTQDPAPQALATPPPYSEPAPDSEPTLVQQPPAAVPAKEEQQ